VESDTRKNKNQNGMDIEERFRKVSKNEDSLKEDIEKDMRSV
jgi:hypothetical protein